MSNMTSTQTTGKSIAGTLSLSQTAHVFAKNTKTFVAVIPIIVAIILCQLTTKLSAQVVITPTSTNAVCATSCDGAIDLKVTGGTAPYTYAWNSSGGTGGTAYKQITLCLTGPPGATNQTATGSCNPPTAITDAAINLCPGTYTVTVTDNTGLTATTVQTITAGTLNVLQVAADPANVTCVTGCTGVIKVNASAGNAPYTYNWSVGGSGGDTRNGLCAGTYSVTVYDKAGCDSILTFNIGPTPTVSIAGSSICAGGSVVLTASGGTAYSWSTGGTGSTISVAPTGSTTYTVTATNAGCPTSTATYNVVVNSSLALTTTPTNVACFGGSNGSGLVNPSGGTAPYTYIWTNAQTTGTATGLGTGSYQVTVTDSKGCSNISTVTITQPTAITVTTTSIKPACGAITGSATVSATGGAGTYTYAWSPPGTSGTTISGVSAGAYTVTVTDGNGCTKSDIITISNNPAPTINTLTGTPPLCNGGTNGTAATTASGGTGTLTYAWSNAGNTTTTSGLSAGTYVVTVTDANGCLAVSTVVITQPTAVAATSSFVNSNCGKPDGSVSVSPTGGTGAYTYIWSGAAAGQTSPATGLLAGSYTVTVSDANGCTTTTSATISTQSPGVASITPTSVKCSGGADGTASTSMSGGTPGFSYVWAPIGGTAQTATGLSAGTYSVTVTDLNGCTSTATASVTQPTVVTASATATTAICTAPTGTATVTGGGGTSPYVYLWDPNTSSQTTTTASGLTAGIYTVTVTDFNGCSKTTTATVIGTNGAGTASVAVQSNVLCFGGTTGALTANMAGGTSPFTYAWTSSATTQTATGLVLGSYTVTITDKNGCQAVSSSSVTEPTPINASTTSTPATCGTSNGTATVTGASGGTGTLTYTWPAAAANQTTTTATGLSSGSYIVTINDANNCTYTTTAIVNDLAPGTATASSPSGVLCNGGNTGSATVTVSGTTASSYLWNNTQTTQTITGLIAGSYSVTVTDNNGCQMISNVTITEPTALTSSTTTTSAPCGTFTGSATVTTGGGTGSPTFAWSNSGTTPTISGIAPGVYTVTITDGNGCTTSTTANVSNSPAPTITSLTALTLKCNGDKNATATVVATGGNGTLTYAWSGSPSVTTTATGLGAGTYNVSVTDAGGCTVVSNVTITEPTAITGTINTTSTTCGSANGSVTVSPVGGTGTFTYVWAGAGAAGQTTASVTGLSAGTYTVTATDANGCTSSASATVNNLNGPVAVAATLSDVTCNGKNNGSASVSNPSNGGTPPFTYAWSGSGGNSTTATGLAPGTYIVTVTDFNGCTSTSTAAITEPTAITSATSVIDATCGISNGSATVTYGGGTGTSTLIWSTTPAQTTATITGLSVGAYNVTITDANGCTKTDVAAVSNNPSPTITSLTATTLLCNGGNNGTATVAATGGTGTLTYSWSNSATAGTTSTSGLAAGIYVVTVTDAGGCAAVSTVTITDPAPIVLSATTTNAICNTSNGSATASVVSGGSGTTTYLWDVSAASQTTALATGLAAGTYTVVVTDGNGCTSSTTATVANTGAGIATASLVNDVTCNGKNDGSATSSISGATASTYLWSSGATTPTATGLAAGVYNVTITDVNGCVSNSTVTINEPTAITNTTTKTDATCGQNNGTASVPTTNGGAGGYSYSWTPGGAGQTITGLGAGSYNVVITDATGCTKTDVVAVSAVPSVPISVSKSDLACNGANTGTATVSPGGTGTFTYSWSNNSTSATITGLAAGTYVVSVTDANGCTSVSTASITEPAALAPSVSSTQAACGQSNGTVTVTNVTGGTAPYKYDWKNSAGTSIGTTVTISGLAAGTYDVVITDDNGCTVTASAIVNNIGGPVLTSITGTDNLCFGQTNGTATVTVTNGTGSTPYTYSWIGGTSAVTSSTSSTISGLAAGTYSVSIKDANGCLLNASVNVTEPTVLATPTTSSSNAACGKSNGSAQAASSGGTGTLTYTWNNGTTSDNATGLAVGTYTVTVTDANGCSKSNTVTIGTSNGPVAVATGTAPLCNGGTNGTATASATPATGTPPYTYSWSTTATTTTISSLVADSTYTVTVTDSKGCSSVSTVKMGNPGPLVGTASGYAALCGSNNGSTKVVVTGGTPAFTYSWSNGGVTDSISNLSAGTYTVAIADANGCTTSSTAIVGTISSSILVVIPAQQTINAGEFVSITVSGGVTYTWSPGAGLNCTNCPNPVATPTVTTTYTVTAIDANGCTATAMMTVTVRQACDDESDVYIANIFSPNDDGKNDKLFVEGNGLTDIYWAIYDRWGNLLFEAFNQTSGWDGTRKGNPMESGTYVYYLRATCLKTNTEVRLKGNVTIVK